MKIENRKASHDYFIEKTYEAGWSAKRSHPAIILDVLHKFYDCGQTRYTFYKLRRTE